MTDADTSLARLAELRERVERLRDETAALAVRRERALEGAVEAQDRERARRHIQTLRHDLDAALQEIEGLHVALQTRGVIEQAKGMIMLKLGLDAEEAFQVLVRTSQNSHVKLVDVARDLVASATRRTPEAPPPG